jgi:hypothetical protein
VRRWIRNGVKLRAVRALADGHFHCVAQDELVSFDTESGKCLGSAGGEVLVPTGNESHPNWLIDIIFDHHWRSVQNRSGISQSLR